MYPLISFLLSWIYRVVTELLGTILEKLVLLPDYIRFGAVCKRWRFAALEDHLDRRRSSCQQPPMLLLPPEARYRRLYSIWERKIYSHPPPIPNNIPSYDWFSGSYYGWLAIANERDFYITLLNPFSGNAIKLPRGPKSTPYHTITLSCDPCLNPNDWVAVAIYGPKLSLAFARAGHASWCYAKYPIESVTVAGFCKGQLYIMNEKYKLFRIAMYEEAGLGRAAEQRVGPRIAKKVKLLNRMELQCLDYNYYHTKSYFVELEGDLVLVCRHYGRRCSSPTVAFDVFKLNYKGEACSADSPDVAVWNKIKDLGEFSLFLGENNPICIHTGTFPDCPPNCIYFTPDRSLVDDRLLKTYVYDMGVFNMDTKRISRYDLTPCLEQSMPMAVWFSPSLG